MTCTLVRGAIAAVLLMPAVAGAQSKLPYVPVVTPNGKSLPFVLDRGVKVFHLIAEQVKRELAPGMVINAWGYNGQTPGPTIEAVEGDRVRILVTNHLPEDTSVHWHGRRAGAEPTAHQPRRDVRLRVHAAPERHADVPPPRGRDATNGARHGGLFHHPPEEGAAAHRPRLRDLPARVGRARRQRHANPAT